MLAEYIDYFRHQATTHPLLLHTPERRVFEVVDFEEAWGDFRTAVKEKDFIMRLVLPSGGVVGHADETVEVLGGFVIARYWNKRNEGDKEMVTAMDASFKVGMDICEKIIADSKEEHPLWYHSANTPDALDISFQPKIYVGDAQYAGYIFLFRWHTAWRNCISSPQAPAWVDGGLTPHL